jgi:hypothetical protein
MTLSALGIFSAAGAGGAAPAGDYQLISTTILGSAQAAVSFNVSGLGSTYRHLELRSVERHTSATTADFGTITINGTNGDETHFLVGTGSSVFTGRDGTLLAYSTGANAVANNFGARILSIVDAFSTTKNKTLRTFYGYVDPSITIGGLQSGLWENTAAMTSITTTSQSTYAAGSRFSLYGIRG